jgi:hypothetical protein
MLKISGLMSLSSLALQSMRLMRMPFMALRTVSWLITGMLFMAPAGPLPALLHGARRRRMTVGRNGLTIFLTDYLMVV